MRLIDADALKFDIMCVYGSNPQYINWLNHAPTVDAVPVIRCRDCKRWNTIFDRNKAEFGLCQTRSQLEATRYDDYCSRAERKEE